MNKGTPQRLLAVLAFAVVVGVNCFTVNCGLPPTDIGIGKNRPVVITSDETYALLSLLAGQCMVYATKTTSDCLAFTGTVNDPPTSFPCTLRTKDAQGAVSAPASGTCTLDKSADDGKSSYATYHFKLPTADILTLNSEVDFQSTPGPLPEGYLIADKVDPTVTATVHSGTGYCDSFK